MADDPIRLAVAEAKAGNNDEARKIVSRVLRSDPDNIRAWIVMAQVVKGRDKAIDCLENVLRLDPDHPWAALHLNRLRNPEASASPSPTPPPTASAETAVHAAAPRDLGSLDDLFTPTDRSSADMDTALELGLEDFGIREPIGAEGVDAGSELDPFAGTAQWTDVGSESEQYTYDQVRDQIERDINPPARRSRRVPCLLLAGIFVLCMVVAAVVAAWQLDMLPF